jgi:hypothetical protein
MRSIFTSLLFLLSTWAALGQASYYTFSQTTAAYQDIDPVGATVAISNFNDNSYNYKLPNAFKLFGQLTGNFMLIGRDGWTTFQTSSRFMAVDPFMSIGGAIVARSQTSNVSARTDVAGGDTIVKVQWKNVNIDNHPSGDHLNFQLWMYKKSQAIEFRYGATQITPDPTDSFDIVMVHFTADFDTCHENQQIYGSGTNVQIETNNDSLRLYSGAVPDGTVFRFAAVTTDVPAVMEQTGARIYPNPTNGLMTIELQGKAGYRLQDATGKTLSTGTVSGKGTIDMTTLPGGMYMLWVEDEVIKLLKQ